MKKFLLFISLLVILATISMGCSSKSETEADQNGNDSGQDQIILKIGHSMTPGTSSRDVGATKIKEYVEKESDGRVKVEIYPASQLGSSKEQIEAIQTGTLEMALFPSSSITDFQPLLTIADIPYLFPTDEQEMLDFYKTEQFKQLLDTGDEIGLKFLDAWFEGFEKMASDKPLITPEDLKGQKIRIIGGDILEKFYAEFDASVNNTVMAEVYNSLSTGLINTTDLPLHIIYDHKLYEVTSDITHTNHYSLTMFVMTGKEWFDSLPDDIQEIIQKGVEEAGPYALDTLNDASNLGEEEMINEGINFHEPSDELKEKFKEAGEKMEQEYIEKFGDKGQQLIEGLKEAANSVK